LESFYIERSSLAFSKGHIIFGEKDMQLQKNQIFSVRSLIILLFAKGEA
jgi:hypothetical protein